MPFLPITYNYGSAVENDNPELTRQLSRSYSLTANIVNTKISKFISPDTDAPASNQLNASLDIGDIYVRTGTDTAWIMTSRTTSTDVTWTQIT